MRCACGGLKGNGKKQCKTCQRGETALRDMSEAEIAWVAGIIEGEGTFAVRNNSAWIRVGMSDEDTIQKLQAITGVGRIHTYQRDEYKTMYLWSVARKVERDALANLILPWMSTRRTDRIKTWLHVGVV